MENWEALDVDDSDLPLSLSLSLLRPCNNNNKNTKRKHQTINNIPTNPQSQTLVSQSQTLVSQSSPQKTTQRRRIPGPAGAAQAAMERRGKRSDDDVSTQECVRRALEDGDDVDDDDDFRAGPWLCAIEFVSRLGLLPSITPLSSVPKFLDVGRIDQVVAVIKTCIANGLGDLMVTLKDPTGKINASIHRKVFADGELGKEICIGSVLILQKVAVFAPSRSALYLNITQNNVVKVISKDSRPPTKQNAYICAVKPTSGQYKESSDIVNEVSSMELEMEMTQAINNGIGQCANLTGSVYKDKETGKKINASSFNKGDQNNASAKKILKVFRKEIIVDEQRCVNAVANLDESQKSEGIMRTDGTQKEKQSQTLTAALPEWTDEQLNELFDTDYADEGFFN